MNVVSPLAKHNRTRGVISWRFIQTDDDCFALRNDGRRWSYIDIDDMRQGWKTIRNMGFAPVESLCV